MQSVENKSITLSVFMPSVVMLNVVAPAGFCQTRLEPLACYAKVKIIN
jgi:hypothetical protein